MTVEIKVGDKVRTVTEGELELLRELGVEYTDAQQGRTEAFGIMYKTRFSPYAAQYGDLTESQLIEAKKKFEAQPNQIIVKMVNLRNVKYKYAKDWSTHWEFAEEPPYGYHLGNHTFFATREDAEQELAARAKVRELEKEHEVQREELRKAMNELLSLHNQAVRELEKKVRPVPINWVEDVPHYKSDRPDGYGPRYSRWKTKTGGKETFTVAGRYD